MRVIDDDFKGYVSTIIFFLSIAIKKRGPKKEGKKIDRLDLNKLLFLLSIITHRKRKYIVYCNFYENRI